MRNQLVFIVKLTYWKAKRFKHQRGFISILLLSCTILLNACLEEEPESISKIENSNKTDSIKYESVSSYCSYFDSLLLVDFSKSFLKYGTYPWNYNMMEETDVLGIYPEVIYYNQDSTKFIGAVSIKINKYHRQKSGIHDGYHRTVYDNQYIVGYKDTHSCRSYNVFQFDKVSFTDFESRSESQSKILSFFKNEIKNISIERRIDQSVTRPKLESYNIGYSPDQDNFWKSVLWKKGYRMKGYFPFETNNHISSPRDIIPPLELILSDETKRLIDDKCNNKP
ncbi:MAG: hypothetical protein KDC84_06515 [Crocinitomicaceae bacterium]|nr:hypothetical protein [Crocinitomicaceae bacterium]